MTPYCGFGAISSDERECSRLPIGIRVMTNAPSTSNPATNHKPELKLPVASFKIPISNGLTAEPTLPTALMTATQRHAIASL